MEADTSAQLPGKGSCCRCCGSRHARAIASRPCTAASSRTSVVSRRCTRPRNAPSRVACAAVLQQGMRRPCLRSSTT